MGCGGCGKRRKQAIQIKRPVPITATGIINRSGDGGKKLCPICRSVMRSLHKYDKSIKKVVRSWYCTRASCPNSRG
jgi:hypothetical protein